MNHETHGARHNLVYNLMNYATANVGGTQISENICSEDDLRSRIFEIFVVKFRACLHVLVFSNI